MTTPRRYQFDNPLPTPVTSPAAPPVVYQPQPLTPAAYDAEPRQVVVQHIHQASPDRTVARVALGAGVGGGAIAAGVYFGPLLVAALASMAASLAMLAVCAVAGGWAVVKVVGSIDGHQNAKAARKSLTGRKR